jgi:hypothetical protein
MHVPVVAAVGMLASVAALSAATGAAAAGPSSVPAGSPLVRWSGRTAPSRAVPGGVAFDWEGVSATVSVANSSWVTVNVTDGTSFGTRLSTWQAGAATTAGQDLHVTDFLTGPGAGRYFISRGQGGGDTLTLRVVNNIEPAFTGVSEAQNITVTGFDSDGVFVPPPPAPTRRLAIIGDSIT